MPKKPGRPMTRLIEPILAGRGVRFQRGFGGMT